MAPGELGTFGEEAFFAEELGSGEVGVNEVPGVEVLVVLEADAVEHAAAADFETAGEVLEFEEGFLELGARIRRLSQ